MDASPSHGSVNFNSLVREQCTVLTSFTIARRQAILDAGLFDPNFRRSEDFDLWLRMAHQGATMDYQRTVLGTHALSEGGLSGDRDALREAQIAVYRKALRGMNLSPEEFTLVQAQVERCEALLQFDEGKDHLLSRHYREAAIAIGRANLFYRRFTLRIVLLLLRFVPGMVRRLYLMSIGMKFILREGRKRLAGGSLQATVRPAASSQQNIT
jgi:hypothetical protein